MRELKRPARIGGRLPRDLHDRLIDLAMLLDVPYIALIERALAQALPGMEFAAKRTIEREEAARQ